jgi:hypothetical protein
MEGDEQGAEQDAERAGKGRGAQPQTHARPDEADGDGEKVEISEEPEGYLIRHPAMTLVLRNVVDGFILDRHRYLSVGGAAM